MVVRRIAGGRVGRALQGCVTIGTGKGAEIIVKCMVLLNDDDNMLDRVMWFRGFLLPVSMNLRQSNSR